MKSKYFQPYGLDIKYEINTYKHVGMDYGNRKMANLGLRSNCKRFIRKSIINRKEKFYKKCDTYTEWKEHVKEILPKGSNNCEDMLHWLYEKRRKAENLLEAIKAILIPVYIAYLSIVISIFSIDSGEGANNSGRILFFVILVLMIVMISAIVLRDAKRKENFFIDVIHIVEDEKIIKDRI